MVVTRRGQYRLADPNTALGAGRDSLYSPLRQLDYVGALDDTISQSGDMMLEKIQDVVAFIKATTGIDLTDAIALLTTPVDALGGAELGKLLEVLGMFIPSLSGSDPATFDLGAAATEFVETVLNPTEAILAALDPTAALNAANLFGQLPPSLLSLVPIASLMDYRANVLSYPGFDGSDAIAGATGWTIDNTVGRTAESSVIGSATLLADGTQHELVSEPGPQTRPGAVWDYSVWLRWRGVTAAGPAWRLVAVTYASNNGTGTPLSETILATISGPATDSVNADPDEDDFVEIAGTFNVGAGVNSIRHKVVQTANVTAGRVWVDDRELAPNQLIRPDWLDLIPYTKVTGIQGIVDLGSALQTVIDNQASGYDPGTEYINLSMSGLTDLAQAVATRALNALGLSQTHDAVLSFRQNQPSWVGLQSTLETNVPVASMQGASAPPVLVAATAANAPMALMRLARTDTKGFVQWVGNGAPSGSIIVNVYKMNPDTLALTKLHTSPNLVTGVPGSGWGWMAYNFAAGAQGATAAGDLLAIEWIVTGTGTHNIAGVNLGWLPKHPDSKLQSPGAARNPATLGASPASIAAGSIGWTTAAVPFGAFGIGTADLPVPFQEPITVHETEQGSYSYTLPSWFRLGVDYVDVIALGAGGGGGSGTGGPGQDGTSSTVTLTDAGGAHTVTGLFGAAGPAGGLTTDYPNSFGRSPGNHSYMGKSYTGGGEAGALFAGNPPGGGGGGGNSFAFYGQGGEAGVWAHATYQPTSPTINYTVGAGGPGQFNFSAGWGADGAVWLEIRQGPT